jgi:hypothetical protein
MDERAFSPGPRRRVLPAIPEAGKERLGWLNELDLVVAEDVLRAGRALYADGYPSEDVQEVLGLLAGYFAARVQEAALLAASVATVIGP